LWCEAFLGDAVLAAGEERHLHDLLIASGSSPENLLAGWAVHAGQVGRARVDAPYQVGWCSWYHYFHDVTEADLDHNLALADSWPFDVFQLDDGYQAAIGDWLITNDKFPSDVGSIADRIAAAGRTPGIWIAPFLAAPDSVVATEHPEWLATFPDGSPLITMFNPPWGGGMGGFMFGLDTTHPEVIEHLEGLARTLVDVGFDYLKLDFTFSPAYDGVWHDPSKTPAQRVRAGYDAIRRGAGDAFLLGCGSPQSNVVGVVDGNRIGPDVAPSWPIEAKTEPLAGYRGSQPSTRNAWFNTAARSFMHRRLWLNDPDCLMLRSAETELTAEQMRTWALAVGVSGGMALVSDDLALVEVEGRVLLDEAIALGRAADAAAVEGRVPKSLELLHTDHPTVISNPEWILAVSPETAFSILRPIS
jgi:alpha-galactosidase